MPLRPTLSEMEKETGESEAVKRHQYSILLVRLLFNHIVTVLSCQDESAPHGAGLTDLIFWRD
ncbi:hypothetical protein AL542_06550 [Grimontia hollisae]|nr:hypothetical protein AL542_06550 [Grimontia hollisae]